MRIVSLENYRLNSVNFEGRSKRRQKHEKKEGYQRPSWTPEFYFEYGSKFQEGYDPFLVGVNAQKSAKSAHPFSQSYFDFDKLSKIELPDEVKEKPAPFEKTHGKYILDRYQQEAIDAYTKENATTIVSAPTGTGKTLIAEYAIKDALDKGKKLIYLSPLKALSNEKYTEFSKLFGEYDEDGKLVNTDNIGLLTGDTQINPDAPILVMTTEIYRNSLLSSDKRIADIEYSDYDGVIYDEFHYMGDRERGTVWEEAVMNTPSHMKQMMLSATASNAQDIEAWLSELNGTIPTHLVNVPESERHVPLREYILTKDDEGNLQLEAAKTHKIDLYQFENRINSSDRQLAVANEAAEILGLEDYDALAQYLRGLAGRRNEVNAGYLAEKLKEAGADKDKAEAIGLILSNRGSTTIKKEPEGTFVDNPKFSKVIKLLNDKKMTPALFYVFSKKGCNKEMEKAADHSESLLTPEESKMVYDEVQKAKEKGVYLGSDFDDMELERLMKGFAVHHAGKLPAYKSLVENLARKGLVKACFATDTLIAGIDMPIRTTVFPSMEKFDGKEITEISNASFKQGSGRAGRRGKDEIGNVIVIPYDLEQYETYVQKTSSKDTAIRSQYQISYASILSERNLNNFDDMLLRTFAGHQNADSIERNENVVSERLDILKSFGYVEQNEDGTYTRTKKGELAKSVFGINEIIMTELLLDPKYLSGMTKQELIAICSMFSDVKDENPSREFKGDVAYLNDSLTSILNLVDDVDQFEAAHGIKEEPTPISTNLAPYIVEFSELPDDRDDAIKGWGEIMNKLREKELIYHNGDFLRVINGTIDILKLVYELSPDKEVQDNAMEAILSLKKPPVVDIFNYELSKNKEE